MSAHIDVDLAGKTAIVTGASTGIGKEIARGLARMGATVVLAVRSHERGELAREEIVRDTGSTRLETRVVDVASPASIRAFVAGFRAQHEALHILVNNAGAWFTERRETTEGRELTFATNVLGPWLLSELLADSLRAGAPSRIVNVVSELANNYDATDLDYRRRPYDGFKAYAQSKAAARMITWAFARRLERSGIAVHAASPGFVRTELNRNAHGVMATTIDFMARIFGQTPAKGADTPLFAAASPEIAGATAKYFDKRKDKPGGFDDPSAIEALDAYCARATRAPGERRPGVRLAASAP